MPTVLLGDLNEWRRRHRSSLDVLEPTFGVPHPVLSFPSRRPIFALDRIFGWPAGLITELAVHNSPLARMASDHLPMTALMRLAAGTRAAA
jgi:endonuclease/exonuclease/phosphatase family metal-dependent hydrolase